LAEFKVVQLWLVYRLFICGLPNRFANEFDEGYKNGLTISDKLQVYSESRMASINFDFEIEMIKS